MQDISAFNRLAMEKANQTREFIVQNPLNVQDIPLVALGWTGELGINLERRNDGHWSSEEDS